jgi:NDP-hexose-3-ketoreductase
MNSPRQMIRFGAIGCGSIAQRSMLPALASGCGAQLVAVASPSSKRATELARRFGCEPVTGYEELVTRSDIDAVYIGLPVGLHARWAIEAAKNSKHVLCEKTLARTEMETREVVEACEKAGAAVMEAMAYRFHPQHRIAKEIVDSGGIGEPLLFQGWFGFPPIDSPHRYDPSLGGGALLDAGTYVIHAARTFFEAEPTVMSAMLDNGNEAVEIYGSAHLRFGSPRSALVAFGFNHMYRNSYSIWGTQGVLTMTRAFSISASFQPSVIIERQGHREERVLPAADSFQCEVAAFCDGIEDATLRRRWAEDAVSQSIVLEQVRSQNRAA